MTASAQPRLKRGRVYRTKEFARWGANPTRLAKRLVREGEVAAWPRAAVYRFAQFAGLVAGGRG